MKKTTTWVLLADGAQARVLENTGPGKGLRQVDGLEFSIPALQAQEIVTDRPGRGNSSNGTRAAIEPRTDPVQYRETEFVKTMADRLNGYLREGAFDKLVIAASPIALGVIRKAISPAVRETVIAELDKDLTNLPTAQLDRHFENILAL